MVILKMKPNTNEITVNTKQSKTKYARNHHISLPHSVRNVALSRASETCALQKNWMPPIHRQHTQNKNKAQA